MRHAADGRKPAPKKRFSASLLGQYVYCPRSAWFVYNGVPEKFQSESLRRIREGQDAHDQFSKAIGKHIRREGMAVKISSAVIFAAMVAVLWWVFLGEML